MQLMQQFQGLIRKSLYRADPIRSITSRLAHFTYRFPAYSLTVLRWKVTDRNGDTDATPLSRAGAGSDEAAGRSPRCRSGPGGDALGLEGALSENLEEIHAFADALLRGQPPLDKITKTGQDGMTAWATYSGASPIFSAELNYTTDSGEWQKRTWQNVPATLDALHLRVSAELPAGVTAYYFNLTDMRNLILSTEHVTPKPQ